MGRTIARYWVAVFGILVFSACDSGDSGDGIDAFTAGEGISIDNQGVISVEFGTEAGEVAAGNDPRFGSGFSESDLQDYLDSHGYTPGAGYADADVQAYLDAQGYVSGQHVSSVDGLQGGTIQGDVTVTGDLTVNGSVSFPGQTVRIRRFNDSHLDVLESTAGTNPGALVHSFLFSTEADPLVTGFVIDLEILREGAGGSGGAYANFRIEDWQVGSATLSWGMGPEDPADTWVPKHITYTQSLPLTGTDHQIDLYLLYSWGGAPGPKVQVRNVTLRWFVAD